MAAPFSSGEDLKPGAPARKASILRRLLHALLWAVPVTVILLASLSGTLMSQVEQPKYTVLESEGSIEVREYSPTIVAEVEVHGERMKALNQGFRLIADYIFGNNLSSKKVAMTAPVTQEAGEKIAMTAPVTQAGSVDSWKVRFVMPSGYTLDSLPKPKNPEVRLLAVPARKAVVIRFSGFNTDKNIDSHRETLLKYIAEHHLTVAGASTTAFYNPPWTLPFLRRNEIMFELSNP
jgi:effector-binding domain-containing protein